MHQGAHGARWAAGLRLNMQRAANTKGQSGKNVGQLNRLEGDTEGAEGVGLQSDHGAVELLELQPT
jgi:hypothetical protein